MRRAALLALASLTAILIQLTLLNRLPLPGGAAPDLVLIMVVAVALTAGPTEGMLVGFFAGLALDIAPPASHLVGQYALVFCLAGYASGRLSGALDRATWLPLGAVALCAAGGEALYAAAGLLFGDPGVTWSAVRQVLPVSVGYDLLLCPFVLYAVVVAGVWAAGGFPSRRTMLAGLAGAPPAPATGAVRNTGTGRGPRLRGGQLRGGQAGSASGSVVSRPLAGRPVHMRFGHGRSGSASGTQLARGRQARPVHMRWRGRMPGGSALSGGTPGSRTLGSKARGSRTLGSKALGSKARGSRTLGSKARGVRVPRGSALRGSGSGGNGVSRAAGSLGSGVRFGYGKGAQPRFRRQPRRGAASGGMLRPRRGRARFGRRSTVWRIGSKRTGGLS